LRFRAAQDARDDHYRDQQHAVERTREERAERRHELDQHQDEAADGNVPHVEATPAEDQIGQHACEEREAAEQAVENHAEEAEVRELLDCPTKSGGVREIGRPGIEVVDDVDDP